MLDKNCYQTLSGGIDCIMRQNAWSLNETNLFFILISVLHKLSTSLNEIKVSFIETLFK